MTDPEVIRRAGARLKRIRMRLGLSIREVERRSRKIVEDGENPDFFLSRGLLGDIEAGLYIPGSFKVLSLAEIYGLTPLKILGFYGIDRPDSDPRERPVFWPPNTQLFAAPDEAKKSDKDHPEAKPTKDTGLVTDLIDLWRDIPVPLLREIDTRKFLFGYVGASDRTMSPLLPPGTYLQIDPKQNRVKKEPPQQEAQPTLRGRAIYFLDIRTGYACGWCELKDGILTLVPHPHSGEQTRTFRYPLEAEVVGRVTAVFFLPISDERAGTNEPEK
jgi:transcriptional regulator with XRE-family HTH domain